MASGAGPAAPAGAGRRGPLAAPMRTLHKIATTCDPNYAKSHVPPSQMMLEGVDFSKLSPYDAQQIRLVSRLCACREALAELTAAQTSGERTRRIAAQQRLRAELPSLATDVATKDIKAIAAREGKTAALERLQKHVASLRDVYRRTTSASGPAAADAAGEEDDPRGPLLRAPGGGAGQYGSGAGDGLGTSLRVGASVGAAGVGGAGGARGNVGLTEEEEREFGGFVEGVMVQARERDALMDEKLDTINVGVRRLKVLATGLGEELAVGEALLTSVEERVESNTEALRGLNARVERAIDATVCDGGDREWYSWLEH